MRILTWNILHGGGRHRLPALLMAMLDARPDVVVVTEARRRFAGQLAGGLADAGLPHALLPDAPDGVNAVLIVSRHPLRRVARPALPACLTHRWLEAEFEESGLALAGVHLPEASRRREHLESWRALIRIARERRAHPFVLAGDFNAWREDRRERSSPAADNLGRLAALGYRDAGHTAESASNHACAGTWRSPQGRWFRLDYVLVSSPLCALVRRSPEVCGPRRHRLSDHRAVSVDLSVARRPHPLLPARQGKMSPKH